MLEVGREEVITTLTDMDSRRAVSVLSALKEIRLHSVEVPYLPMQL
jgi:hypothetical protein